MYQDEIYYSLASSEILIPESITGHCTVTSKLPDDPQTKSTETWSRTPSKRGKTRSSGDDEDEDSDENTSFYCHLVVDSMRGLYYDLDWDQHHRAALASTSKLPPTDVDAIQWSSGTLWDVSIAEKPSHEHHGKHGKLRPRKKVKLVTMNESGSEANGTEDEYEASSDEDPDGAEEVDGDPGGEESDSSLRSLPDDEPRTPSKKKRTWDTIKNRSPSKRGASTPRKPRTTRTLVHPTPHSKARKKIAASIGSSPRKRRFAVRPQTLMYATHDLSHLPRDPWLRAMHVLHVGNRPDALPCREEEFERVLRCVGELLEEGSGGCVCKCSLLSSYIK